MTITSAINLVGTLTRQLPGEWSCYAYVKAINLPNGLQTPPTPDHYVGSKVRAEPVSKVA